MVSDSDDVLRQLQSPPAEYRPVAFWFLNHRLEEVELVRQVEEMAAKGMGGFMLHARNGLRSAYLKTEWREALEAAIAAAERLGLQVWLYDENHYPSSTAGDLLPVRFPDRTMKSLAVLWEGVIAGGAEVNQEICGEALSFIAVAGSLESPLTADLTEFLGEGRLRWTVPSDWGRASIVVLGEIPWKALPGHAFAYYPDYLDPELTDEFVEITHKWYYENFGERFGNTIRGIFSDNSCGNFGHIRRAIPWGRDFEERFNSETGLELREILPALFHSKTPGAERARLIFWRFFGQVYLASYFRRITDYCDSVGLINTGHLCLEEGMGEHARQIGDYFEVMRHFTQTAVDQLGPEKPGGGLTKAGGEHLACCLKNTSSAARFTGSPRVMCESFGLSSAPWELDLFEMKRISGWMAALGVDQFVPHGLFYSIAGSRKWECTPDHLHNPLWQYYSEWTDWIGRLCTAGVDGANRAEVAVLYPIHTLRAHLELDHQSTAFDVELSASDATNLVCLQNTMSRGIATDFVEATYTHTLESLIAEGLDFEVIDEEILASGQIGDDGCLRVPAPRNRDATFRVLILPAMTVIERRSLPLLEEFVRAGGMLLFLNAVPKSLFDPDNSTFDPMLGVLAEAGTPLLSHPTESARIWDKPIDAGLMRLASMVPGGNSRFLADQLCDRIQRHIALTTTDGSRPAIITRSWEKEGRSYHFAFNHSRQAIPSVAVSVADPESFTRIDLATGQASAWDGGSGHDFEPAEGLLLVSNVPSRTKVHRKGQIVETIPLEGPWVFQTDKPNVLPLKQWTTNVRDNSQFHTVTFESDIDGEDCRLLLDLERSISELDAQEFGQRFGCLLNEREIDDFGSGTYLDRNIYEARVRVQRGTNTLEVRASACNIDWENRLWPPMIIGDFTVPDRTVGRIGRPPRDITVGSWGEKGFPCFSGEGSYAREVTLPECGGDERCLLDLGQIASAGRVLVDGCEVGVRIAPPWEFDLTTYAGQTVELTVKVTNTPHNLFMQDALSAGLLGPVTIQKFKIL